MNGGLALIGALLSFCGAKSYNKIINHKRDVMVQKCEKRYRSHTFSKEVDKVFDDVVLNRHGKNSLGETTLGIHVYKGFSLAHSEAICVIHELIYREIAYDPFQVYDRSGYQRELDEKTKFYKVK